MPREEDRIPHLEEVELEFASGRHPARVSDISRGGCYVDSIASVQVGSPVNFVFSRADANHIKFTGEVAYVLEGFGFGIKFTGLSDEAAGILEKLIAEKA